MYHANHNQDVILKGLLVPDGVVRVVFATVGLGMGVGGDVNSINYGALNTI